jgi:hypothetical protein
MSIASAISELLAAKSAHDAAQNGYDGGSWGYHGHYYITRLDSAEKDLNREIDEAIQDGISKAIQQMEKK